MAEVRSLLIGLVLFSAVLFGMSSFYSDLVDPTNLAGYGLNSTQIDAVNPQNLTGYVNTDEVTQLTKDIQTALDQHPTGIPAVDAAWGYLNAGFAALAFPLAAVGMFTNILTGGIEVIGIPAWIIGVIITIITLIIVLEILSAYLKWRV